MTSYKPLWHILLDKNMTKTELRIKAGISSNTITRMGKGEEISTSILNRILKALDLTSYDEIMEYIPEEVNNG